MIPAISVTKLDKIYDNGLEALKCIDLDIHSGEIFALLGPNGAGKTTLINSICGIVKFNAGNIKVCGYDSIKAYRKAREHIGLVPQELTTDAFETVWNTVCFSRGLFGKPPNPDYIETLLKQLSIWDKRNEQLRRLSGGMKRRVMIAKALSHEPSVLFLDEPSAGVDVELRKSMWEQVRKLRETGVTIILTTHYIEEAEQMADRIGVIHKGKIILVEEKKGLMKKLGKKELILELYEPLSKIPPSLFDFNLKLELNVNQIVITYDPNKEDNGVSNILGHLKSIGVNYKDIHTKESSLEDIFVNLVNTV